MRPYRPCSPVASWHTLYVCLALIVAGLLSGAAPRAAWESAVDGPAVATARLLDAGPESDGRRLIGVEIRLAAGWFTYWRTPGETGMPPRIDWSRSANVTAMRVAWPAPTQRRINGRDVNAYERELVLPVWIEVTEPARPADLRVTLDYGICNEVCVPARANLDLTLLPPGARDMASPYRPLLNAALGRVPMTRPSAPADASARFLRDPDGTGWVVLDLALPWERGAALSAFLEGPGGIVFAHPQIAVAEGGRQAQLKARLARGQFAENSRSDLRVTLVQGANGIEQRVPLTIRR